MKKINFSEQVLPHLIAVLIFLVVTVLFFKPVFFDNKVISQGDIEQWSASSKELRDYRDASGEEGLWAATMFSGMPAYLVNLEWSNGPVLALKKALSIFLPHPVSAIFLSFVCYYILLLSFRVRPWFAIAGALAFGLSSYMIIGISAGHNARIGAIAFVPLVIAGIHLAFNNKRILGVGITALGLALHLRENHLQITYYMFLVVLIYGLIQLIEAFRTGQVKEFFKTIVILIPAAALAVGTFSGQLWSVAEYTRYSIRGPSEIAKADASKDAAGLSRDYAFQYKYGVGESIALMVPNIYGGTSTNYFVQDQGSASYKALMGSGDQETANTLAGYTSAYWGVQGFTAGSYYAGAIVCFLFVLGIVFAPKKYVWWLVPVALLGLMLSWGDSFASFNYFMFDYFPGYNKFRSVSFALMMTLFAMPLLGFLGLENLLKEGWSKATQKKLLWPVGLMLGFCLVLLAVGGFGSFMKPEEAQLPPWFKIALQKDRVALVRADAWRAFWFIAVFTGALFLLLKNYIKPAFIYPAIALLIVIDLGFVDSRYFSQDNYKRKRDQSFAAPTAADEEVLKDKSNYRVLDMQTRSPFTDARPSQYHQSLGGYHGAKLRRYQDLYDSGIFKNMQALFSDIQTGEPNFTKYGVFNMLNTKYIIAGPQREYVIRNTAANGDAWFVKDVVKVDSPAEELQRTVNVNTRDVAVMQLIDNNRSFVLDSAAVITLVERTPPYLKYESQSPAEGFAVFSEIYYPKGWHAFIDGKEVPLLRADYVLRALQIPAGKHVIEFRFEPKPYVIGNKITMASSWILLLVVIGSVVWSVREPKQNN